MILVFLYSCVSEKGSVGDIGFSKGQLRRVLTKIGVDEDVSVKLTRKQTEEILFRWEKGRFEEKPVLSSMEVGKELGADFVCIGYLFRFEERIGSSLGVERPASVSFDLHLFRLKDEKMVWVGKFDEIQRPLNVNLLKIGSFFRRKASWLTAAELASVGIGEMLKKLPGAGELEEK